MSGPELSIVVCGHDAAATLPPLLASVERQSAPRGAFEVVYVDDGSGDGSADIGEAASGAVDVVVRLPRSCGAATARNRGLARAQAPLVAFADSDVVLHEEFVMRGVRRFADGAGGLLAGAIRIPVGPRPTIAALVDASSNLDQEGAVRDGYAISANLWMPRAVADAIGGFDEQIPAMYGEDEELCRRARRAGHAIAYAPDVVVVHPPRTRARDVLAKSYRIGRSKAVLRRLPSGSWAKGSQRFRRPRSYLPPKRPRGLERLAALDYEPTALDLARVYVARYVLVQLAGLLGELAGEARTLVPGRRLA